MRNFAATFGLNITEIAFKFSLKMMKVPNQHITNLFKFYWYFVVNIVLLIENTFEENDFCITEF